MGLIETTNPTVKMIDSIRNKIFRRVLKGESIAASEVATLQKHMTVAEQMGEHVLLGRLHETEALVYLFRGDLTQAREKIEAAFEIYRAASDIGWMANSKSNLGEFYRLTGDFEKAMSCYLEAREILTPTHDYVKKAIVECNLGLALLALGRLQDAEACFNNSLTLAAQKAEDSQPAVMEARRGLGEIHLDRNEIEPAWRNALEAVELAKAQSDNLTLAEIYLVCAHIAEADSQSQAPAETYYRMSRELLSLETSPVVLARHMMDEARYQRRHGRVEESRIAAAEAHALFLRMNMTLEAQYAEALL